MRPILAIDPGTTDSAYVVWDGQRFHSPPFFRSNEEVVQLIRQGSFNDCSVMAIEMIACYGMPVGKETFETCVWIGRFIEAAYPHLLRGLYPRMVFRKDVKIHLCGSTKAKDGNVRQALIDKIGPVGTKKAPGPLYGVSSHLWSALAVADYSLSVPR